MLSYDIYQGTAKTRSVRGAGGRPWSRVCGPSPLTPSRSARDAADDVSPASDAARRTTAAGTDDGRDTAPADLRAATHRADGAYHVGLSWVPPQADGVITEYGLELDGRPATSLVWGETAPQGRTSYSFYVGREAGVGHRVRIRARLPDGTWGGWSPERTVTTGAASQP